MVTVSVEFSRTDGSRLNLLVECSVSGRYRPAKINADPDDCYEAEYPEVEIESASIEEGFDVNDEPLPEDAPTELDLASLSSDERRILEDLVYRRAVDAASDAAYDYEPLEHDDF